MTFAIFVAAGILIAVSVWVAMWIAESVKIVRDIREYEENVGSCYEVRATKNDDTDYIQFSEKRVVDLSVPVLEYAKEKIVHVMKQPRIDLEGDEEEWCFYADHQETSLVYSFSAPLEMLTDKQADQLRTSPYQFWDEHGDRLLTKDAIETIQRNA